MFKNKNIWYVLIVLSVLFTYSAFKIFPKAFPILNIDLEMTREDALQKSTEMAKIFNLGPNNPSQAAKFNVDQNAQNFIELDQGGSAKLIEILDKQYY